MGSKKELGPRTPLAQLLRKWMFNYDPDLECAEAETESQSPRQESMQPIPKTN